MTDLWRKNRRGWMGARGQFDMGDEDGDLCTNCGQSYLKCKCVEVRNTPQTSDKEGEDSHERTEPSPEVKRG